MKEKYYLMLTQASKAIADDGRKSMEMRVRSRITELCQCMGIVNTLLKLQFFIFITRIGNLLINSLYGATETFAS